MTHAPTPTAGIGPGGRLLVGALALLVPASVALGPALSWWTATRGESAAVTGVVPVRVGDEVRFLVSGHAERTTEDSQRRSHTAAFPRLTAWSGADGARLVQRSYAPVILRFSYVDTVVRALGAGGGLVWAVSTDPATGLHAVDPVDLTDRVTPLDLAARHPVLSAGLHLPAGAEPAAVVIDRHVRFRTADGHHLALDLDDGVVSPLPADAQSAEDSPADPRGHPAVEAAAVSRPGLLDPDVAPVFTLDGAPDPTASYVVTLTTLDRATAGVQLTRWDPTGPEPTAGWTTPLPDVGADCCQLRVWRDAGRGWLWYERWLVAFDDATGTVQWVRRL